MNYGGNMPDWHQYNSTQPIGSEVPPVGQNANHSPIFGSNISPRRLNGPTFSPEGLNKPQNEANFNPRNFQQSPNTLNGPNVPPDNPPMGPAAQLSGCHGAYRALSPRNTMIESTGTALDSRNIPSSSLSDAIGQRNHQISMNRPASHLNCSTINGSMAPMAQRNTPTTLQAPIPSSSRQGPGSYLPCKLPCCNPDTNISYQSWEKFGPYPPNVPYRDTGYPVDNRRFGSEFENREQLGAGAYNLEARRNFPDYKYRKDTIIPRPYAPPPGVIQNYPIQNYNFPADYQKYPAYPIKEYLRESSIPNPQNPGILKYQEQSVIVQQKYFTKQIQYQNGAIPKSIGPPTSMGSNVISRAQNPYFNSQLGREFPQGYSDSTPLNNRGVQSTNPIHAAYPKYQLYQQKIAMQRFSMENHLRELTRIPGYQSHPKYQDSVLKYRELLRLQQSVDYQSTIPDQPNVVTSQVNEDIPPINLQFDQNGVLINSNFVTPTFSNIQSPINLQNSKNVQRVNNTEVGPLNLQYSEQFKTQASIDNRLQGQDSSLSQSELPRKNEQHYSVAKDQLHVQKYESESLIAQNPDDRKSSSVDQSNSKDFADKPELDVRQFLANWDESEDEDGANANLPDVVLSNSTSGVAAEYENTNTVSDNHEESENCSETEECGGRDDCGIFENTKNETKHSNSTDIKIYQCELLPGGERTKSIEQDLGIPDSGNKPIRTGTVIQPTSAECENQISLHAMENLASSPNPAVHGSVKLSDHTAESLNNNESHELSHTIKDDNIVKKESFEEETISSIKEHIKSYSHEDNTEMSSNIEELIENDDSRSSCGNDSSENAKYQCDSDDDLSESCDSDSMDSHSISSYIKSPETIKGTEIHVDAQELSAISVPPKSNSDTLDSQNIQKQNSFASEESHNPDDISLPDLPTSECTPISTTLNTPIHSDSEESSEPVIDLTTPANPIEIIQNSPMLSFTHSPIKMEPYEHLDENDLAVKVSHDALDFEFQTSNSYDNDYDKLTDASSHGTEQYNIPQHEEDTFDSDCIEVLSEKGEQKIEVNTREAKRQNDVIDNITDQNRFTFHKGNVVTTDKANTTVDADNQPWPSVTVREHSQQISNAVEHQDAKSDIDKLETLSEMKDRLSIMSEVTEDHSKDEAVHVPSAENYHNTSRWQGKCDMDNIESESTDNMTALNLVKDESKIKSDSSNVIDRAADAEVVEKARKNSSSSSNEDIEHQNESECKSLMENKVSFTSTEHTVGYTSSSSSSEEDEIYSENTENRSNFTGSLNIPLIPGEDFEEPKMPVLPMEGNCLTKIIKNTSPITDLDVLGSDDEKLDKMDEIWGEVGSVETVDKVTDVSIDTYSGCGDSSDREKSSSSKNKPRQVQKYDWKCLKNSVKPKDPNKLLGKVYNDSQEMDLKTTAGKNSHLDGSNSEKNRKEYEPINEDFQSAIISGTDNTATILKEKHNFIKVPTISRVQSNNQSREDSKQSHDVCLENNTTEILKSKEKANNINDIATKLLENARLFEPDLKKIEAQRRESSCGENSKDGSKQRIKLLKEFRKVRSKTNTDNTGIQLTKPVDAAEDCKKVDAETMKVNNETVKDQNVFTEHILPKFDSSITNSTNTLVRQVIQKIHVNAEKNTSHVISTDILIPGERLNAGEATLDQEHTPRESCSIVNQEYNSTVEDCNSCGHSSDDVKAASSIDENTNECALNLSKSSDDFGSFQTSLNEKACITNDSHNSPTSEHMEIEEPIGIESKTKEETNSMATKDDSPALSHPSCPEDSGLCTEVEEEDDETLEINHSDLETVKEDNCKCSSISTCMNSDKDNVWKEEAHEKIDQESTKAAGHEDNVATLYSHSTEIVNSIDGNCPDTITQVFEINDTKMNTIVSMQSEHPKSNGLVTIEQKGDQKSADETVDSEITCNADSVQNYAEATVTESIEVEASELVESINDSDNQPLSNNSAEENISTEGLNDSLQRISNVSEDKVVEPVENETEPTLVNDKNKRENYQREIYSGKLSDTHHLRESEPILEKDSLIKSQKTLQDPYMTTCIETESETIQNHLPFEIIEKPSIRDESLIEQRLKNCTKTESTQRTNTELVSEADKNLTAADATMEAFGLENSFSCDFSNFDVAPNFTDAADTDQSNNWKYSKAYARFEDCERYKNPDNFVDPILTSLDTLDNLHTVPVYTTKDGKITYSPNPRFTYRALIMEAREREGYPTLRESYCENPRIRGSSNYSRNQASFRKRKNSETYSYSGSYGKKNYSDYYDPREHGESSMKNSPEPRNSSYFSHAKYNHQSRDRVSHHFPAGNSDAEKKYSVERVLPEKASAKHKNREGSAVFNELNKRNNGTSDSFKGNNKKQYKQSTEQFASDFAWSGIERNLKCNQDSSEIAPSKSDTNKLINNKKNTNSDRIISTEKYTNNSKNGNRSKALQQAENFIPVRDENKHATESIPNTSSTKAELNISSEIRIAKKESPKLTVDNLESRNQFQETENTPLNDQNPQSLSSPQIRRASTMKPRLYSFDWEDSCEELSVQQKSFSEVKTPPTESLLKEIEEVCERKTEVDDLYEGVGDIHQSKTAEVCENKSDDADLSVTKCITPVNVIQSPTTNERVEESGCNQAKLDIHEDESIINNTEKEHAFDSRPVEVIQDKKVADEQKFLEIPETPEIQDKSESAACMNEEMEGIREKDKFDKPYHIDRQPSLDCAEKCTSEVKHVNQEDLVENEILVDEQIEPETLNQIEKVQDDLVSQHSDTRKPHSSEDLCSTSEINEIEREEPPIKPYNIELDNRDDTSMKNVQQANSDSPPHKVIWEYENTSKSQSQCENYIAYSPTDESPEAMKTIPKLVIKKTDSLGCKNVCPGPLSATSNDSHAEKVLDKEEHSSKVSAHPKIPKILIRNAKSRPSTPSIEEVRQEKSFSITTKEDSKVPKVKIRFDEKKPRSPTVSLNHTIPKTDTVETKIPKMKIKLEDRLSKVIIENIDTECSGPNEEVQKTVPKMKIKKLRGTLRQIVDTQILPVSIPRMLIYAELESEIEATQRIITQTEDSTFDKNSKPVTPISIPEDQKTGTDADVKKIPKLKIKRQSSGCSVEMNRKRHSVSPIQPELKKIKKSLKLAESNDKNQFNKLIMNLENHNSVKKLDTFRVKHSCELDSSETSKFTAAAQYSEFVRGEQTKSTGENISGTPEEIPKVIIKRTSPSAEFKCELSKVKRDAIIKNKRWQPEVKLQRSWVLDCMAKDLNLDKLRLKIATPDSILRKCLLQRETEVIPTNVKNGNVHTNRSDKKLFRSKSTSELLPAHGSMGNFAKDDIKHPDERNAADLQRELITPKRCKSDLGGTFSEYSEHFIYKKKLRHNNNSSTIELMSNATFNNAHDGANSSNIQCLNEADMVEYRAVADFETNLNVNEIQSNNEAVDLTRTSEISQDITLAENMNVEEEISATKVTTLLPNNSTSDESFLVVNSNSEVSSSSTNTTITSKTGYACYENSNEIDQIFKNNLKMAETDKDNESHPHYSATKDWDGSEASKDSSIVKNTNVDPLKRHTKPGKKNVKGSKNHHTEKEKTVENKKGAISKSKNISTNCTKKEKTPQISAAPTASNDEIVRSEINTKMPTESVIHQKLISLELDVSIPKNTNSDISSCDVMNKLNNFQTTDCKNNLHKLDINDNSDNNGREEDDNNVVENSISYISTADQENTFTLNSKVLLTSAMNHSESIDLHADDVHDPEVDINLNNSTDNASEIDANLRKQMESSEDREKIIEILSATSPSLSQSGMEIQLCNPHIIEENGICLYHEDAIPTQFELELEIIDNSVPDPLEVPMPQCDQPADEFCIHSGDEPNRESHHSSRISNASENTENIDKSKAETTSPEDENSQDSSMNIHRREKSAYHDKQDTISSADIDEWTKSSSAQTNSGEAFDSNIQKSFNSVDSLIEEVLAAKERLRKYLGKNRNDSRFKVKARPKTAAEKKQGSSFDLNIMSSCENSFTKLDSHSSTTNFFAEANSSKQMDQNLSCVNNNEKLLQHQHQTKTELKINEIKSERKHSKGSKNNVLLKKYSSLPTNIQKYMNLTQVEGYLIPNSSAIDIKDRVEFTKGETTISLRNSKHLIKNHSYSESRKKIPELINSKDSKYRSKSSRHDVNSKHIAKSKSSPLPNTVVQETSLDSVPSDEKLVYDASKPKYKLTKSSSDHNDNSSEKAKFKPYKIPKIGKPLNSQNERMTERLRESQSKEARMPILEPQVDLNGGLEAPELSSDRELSRSPPVITNQESEADYEAATDSLECPVSCNEKEALSRRRTTLHEKEIPEKAPPSSRNETTVADIVNDMAYHEKATIRHRRYCTLCERWFPTVARYRRHLSGYQHRHTELTQRRTIHALFTLFTGRLCPRLQPPGEVRIDCEPGELTPLQIAVQGVTKESNKVDRNIKKPTREDK